MVRPILCGLGLLLAVLVVPSAAQDKKDAEKPEPKTKVETREKLVSAGEFTAKIMRVGGEQKQLTVQVTYLDIDPGKVQANQNFLAQRQLDISRASDPQERLRRTVHLNAEMQRRQQEIYKQVYKNVELQAADDLVVRQLLPPVEYDEKGKPRRLTEKEKRDLRGSNPKVPGYAADFDNLKQDQIVTITLVRKKGAPQPRPKDKGKDFLADEEKAQAKMIVILSDPSR